MKRKPFVLSTHGSLLGYKKYLPAGLPQIPYVSYDLLTLKMSAKRADAIVVSSRFELEDAIEFGIPKERVRIIPMGIDLEASCPQSGKPANAPLNILFVGRLARVRRVELLLHAVKRLFFSFQVTIVGGEEETSSLAKSGYLDELKKLCAELGIAERVTFVGAKSTREVKSYYPAADVFVYPSLYENFGQPLLEAAAAGLPIVSTSVGVARDVVRDGETGFLVSADPAVIAEKIAILRDSALRLSFGDKLRKVVREEFGWDGVIRKYLDLYRSLGVTCDA